MQGREKKKGGGGKRKRRNPLHCPHEEAHSTDTCGEEDFFEGRGGDWHPEISDYADWASGPKNSWFIPELHSVLFLLIKIPVQFGDEPKKMLTLSLIMTFLVKKF